jgi:hypothetical protein
MNMKKTSLLIAVAVVALAAVAARAQQIHGEYVETRNADIYTGQCFANSEVGLMGDQAIVAWRIAKGEWNGVRLDGLHVVGVTRAADTLGSSFTNPFPAKSVLILDERASAEQRAALAGFAREMGGRMFENIVRTETAPIQLDMEYHGEHPMAARVRAGNLATIETRPIGARDKVCGHEETYYAPLTPTAHAMPAVAELDQFKGAGLNAVWSLSGKRSAFVGNFVR